MDCKTCGEDNEYYQEYQQNDNLPMTTNLDTFKSNYKKYKKDYNNGSFKTTDIYKMTKTLIEAILFPEKFKGFKFPAPFMLPSYCYQQKSSFVLRSNANGCAFVQVNFGQYLIQSNLAQSTVANNVLTNNALSNVFYSAESSTLDGVNSMNEVNSNGSINIIASDIMLNGVHFNTVRPGN